MKDNNTSLSILVVEDELTLANVITIKLKKEGFTVYTANTVDEALKILTDVQSVDAVWLDHYLPHKNGIELVQQLKKSATWSEIPIFLVSNTATREKIYSYIELGVKKYYIKAEKRLEEIVSDIRTFLLHTDAA